MWWKHPRSLMKSIAPFATGSASASPSRQSTSTCSSAARRAALASAAGLTSTPIGYPVHLPSPERHDPGANRDDDATDDRNGAAEQEHRLPAWSVALEHASDDHDAEKGDNERASYPSPCDANGSPGHPPIVSVERLKRGIERMQPPLPPIQVPADGRDPRKHDPTPHRRRLHTCSHETKDLYAEPEGDDATARVSGDRRGEVRLHERVRRLQTRRIVKSGDGLFGPPLVSQRDREIVHRLPRRRIDLGRAREGRLGRRPVGGLEAQASEGLMRQVTPRCDST